MNPSDSRVEADRKEERKADQNEDLARRDHDVRQRERARNTERANETNKKRGTSVKSAARTTELVIRSRPCFSSRMGVNIVEDLLSGLLRSIVRPQTDVHAL